ncbi:MAG: L,D-transpeptidase family protein [Propionibacteriaceae bacterium]|jgi:lipoprotein-anchoring transpeptidase ErfK/SrfK|nr:L,D-transpeptidase family protein [Propionibacteriaceae bacterium]
MDETTPHEATPLAAAADEAVTPPAESSPQAPEAATAGNKRKIVLIAVLSALLLVAIGVAGAVFFISNHYAEHAKPGVTVAGVDVSGQSRSEIAAMVTELTDEITVPLSYEGTKVPATLKDLGVSVDVDATVDAALAAGGEASLVDQYSAEAVKPVDLVLEDDSEALQDWLNETFVPGKSESADASVVYDPDAARYTAKPGQKRMWIEPAPVAAVIDGLAERPSIENTIILTAKSEDPKILDDAALTAANDANHRLDIGISVTNGAGDYFTVSDEQVISWASITPKPDEGVIAVTYDTAKIVAELPSLIADELSVSPIKEIRLTLNGQPFATEQNGSNGLRVTGSEAAAQQVADALTGGNDATISVTTESIPFTTEITPIAGGGGERWIEVSLGAHTLTAFEGETVVLGPLAIVDGGSGTPTDPGVFTIEYKLEKQTMRGEDYETENVPWVMYYNLADEEAIHGAYWRTSFGYSDSHGCVNVPVDQAKFLYDWAPVGAKVVVH